jgi:hypothetical protein
MFGFIPIVWFLSLTCFVSNFHLFENKNVRTQAHHPSTQKLQQITQENIVKKFTHNCYTSSYVPPKWTIDNLYLCLLSRWKVTSKLDTCFGPIQILLTCKNQSPGIGLTYTVLKRTTCTNPNWPSFQHNNCLLGCFEIKWN